MRRANQLRVRHARCDEAGSALLEMAFCISLVLLVVFAIMECSLAVYTEHFVESAAASAVRYATVRGSTYSGTSCATSSYFCEAGSSDIQSYIRANTAPGITATKLSAVASWPGTTGGTGTCYNVQGNDSPGCLVTVTVTYPFTLTLPGMANKTITFSAKRSSVISQ